MPQIDQLSQAMQRQGATRATLISDAAMTFNVGNTVASGTVMSSTQLQKFLDEIVPAAQRDKMFQDGVFSFIHATTSGSLCVNVRRQSPRFHVTIEPAAVLKPFVEPVVQPTTNTVVLPLVQPATNTVVLPVAPHAFVPLEAPHAEPLAPYEAPQPVMAPPASIDPLLQWQSKVMRQPIESWEHLWKAREHSLAQSLAIGGTLLICVGLFMPFLHLPILGDLGWKDSIAGALAMNQGGEAMLKNPDSLTDFQTIAKVLMGSAFALTLMALVAAGGRWYEAAAHCAEGVGAGAFLLFVFLKLGIDKALAQTQAASGSNPLTDGITKVISSQIYPTNAWILVVLGTLVIFASTQIWKFSLPRRG